MTLSYVRLNMGCLLLLATCASTLAVASQGSEASWRVLLQDDAGGAAVAAAVPPVSAPEDAPPPPPSTAEYSRTRVYRRIAALLARRAALAPPLTPEAVLASCASPPNTYSEFSVRPVRKMWSSNAGYCGEASVQLVVLQRGIWIGQQQARAIGVNPATQPGSLLGTHQDTMFEARDVPAGVQYVVRQLGLEETYWDRVNQTLTTSGTSKTGTTTPPTSSFVLWVKQQIAAGRPVLVAVRTAGIFTTRYYYDHIVTFFGTCYTSTTTLPTSDQFVFADTLGVTETVRAVSNSKFYGGYQKCSVGADCIPNDFNNFGLAVGGLKAPSTLYLPSVLKITGWSNGVAATSEPGENAPSTGSSTTAKFNLTVSGMTQSASYKIYKVTGLFTIGSVTGGLPQSTAALATACTNKGTACVQVPFTATAATMTFTEAWPSLGTFAANSITYFLVVSA